MGDKSDQTEGCAHIGAPERETRVLEPTDGSRRRSHHACRALLRELRRRRCRAAVSPGPERSHESVHQLIAMVTVGLDASAAEGGARQAGPCGAQGKKVVAQTRRGRGFRRRARVSIWENPNSDEKSRNPKLLRVGFRTPDTRNVPRTRMNSLAQRRSITQWANGGPLIQSRYSPFNLTAPSKYIFHEFT